MERVRFDERPSESVLTDCLHASAACADLETGIEHILKELCCFYQGKRAFIFEFDFEQGEFNNTFEWCASGVTSEKSILQNIPIDFISTWFERFEQSGDLLFAPTEAEIEENPLDYQFMLAQGMSALIIAPLRKADTVFGFIGVADPEVPTPSSQLLRAVSELAVLHLEKHRLSDRLEFLFHRDPLTGVYNRACYVDTLLGRYKNVPGTLGVVSVSINGLRDLNAVFGERHGDTVIRRTAEIMQTVLLAPVYRIGGDEFISPHPDISQEDFHDLVEALRGAFQEDPLCDVAVGHSWADGLVDIDEQIVTADARMRKDKEFYYSGTLHDERLLKKHSASNVLDEIEAGKFIAYYQPQIDLQTGQIIGAEALVRKRDEDGRLLTPAQFLTAYEVKDTLFYIDLFMLENALRMLNRLQREGLSFRVSVNFARNTFLLPDFAKTILQMCEMYNVSPANIILEVTESISKLGRNPLQQLLTEVKDLGLSLSLDDFGSKYSNISILNDIRFDEVKFDKSLVDDLVSNPRSQIILENLAKMCRDLNCIHIVAEGIELEEQIPILQQCRCNLGQGYYFYHPLAEEELIELLHERPVFPMPMQ